MPFQQNNEQLSFLDILQIHIFANSAENDPLERFSHYAYDSHN